ncbi:hypothetical protein AWC38_SpisGene14283 [Stylophora pistillata]|uniref:Tyr recombinase domain-containing protein n=1 Tax=Stylophora pistillata TaxID=50429 RepID=A0A2B4RXE6_STYPI|nr:hypothetical protein AWC38_SpisGene14283 [Stylophora pistillata]
MGDSNNAAPEMDESHEDTSGTSQSAQEGSLNKAIFSINENMAKKAAIFENMCDTKGPPAKKRKARGEDSMSASDPESEEEAGPSTSHHMDDNVSLYACDELEDDDAIKVLTERNKNPKKVIDQKSSKGKMPNSLADDGLDEDVTTLVNKWTNAVMKSAGIDITAYSAHSTRSASTSSCKAKGLAIQEILKAAGWFNSGTFTRFYEKPVDRAANFGHTLSE